jgi:hypothetical protein
LTIQQTPTSSAPPLTQQLRELADNPKANPEHRREAKMLAALADRLEARKG